MNADAMLAIIVLAALALIYFGPWQSVCTAFARQVMFEKRDALFDLAQAGELRFDDEGYRAIRASIEMLIRYAHDATLLNFLFMRRSMRRFKVPTSELSRHVAGIGNPVTRNKVKRIVAEAHFATLSMMLAKSIVAVPFLLIYFLLKDLKTVSFSKARAKALAEPYGEMVQVEAEAASINIQRRYAMAA